MTFKRANLVQIAKVELIRRGADPTFLAEKISWALGVSWPFKHANLVQIAKMELIRRGVDLTFLIGKKSWALGVSLAFKRTATVRPRYGHGTVMTWSR